MKAPRFLVAGLLLAAPALAAAQEAGTEASAPCRDEAFRAFDFWVGSWEVRTPDGRLAGHNRIDSAQNGCVLVEHWTGAAGNTGMSMNYLDRTRDEWVQLWTGAEGSQVLIRGGPTEEGMLLEGHIHYVGNGTTAKFRGSWTLLPDGRVRQFFEESADGGKTWKPWFEGFYSRIDQGPEATADGAGR